MPHKYKNEFKDEVYDDELSLLDIFNILWRRKFLIIFLTGIFGLIAMVRSLLAPFTYRAECRIFPPQSGTRIEGMSARLGGLADLVGIPRGATGGQLMLGILKSDSIADYIIDKFNLMEELSTDVRSSARSSVRGAMDARDERTTGIITIAYIHKDPQRAADMANAIVSALQHKIQELAISDAQQRRNFFETQLMQAQQELNQAEDNFINYQQKNGVIVFESQAQSLLASIASLKNQIAAKNVEISSMKSYARPDNPRMKLAQSQLDAMNQELRRLEAEQKRSDMEQRSKLTSNESLTSLGLGQIPEVSIEYQRYIRALQFATAKYELMLRQYEGARISEANDMTSITVLDYATPPDNRFSPRRTRMTLMGAGLGLGIALGWTLLSEYIQMMKKEQARKNKNKNSDTYEDYDDDDE